MIPFIAAQDAFVTIFSFIPVPIRLLIITMVCLRLGVNFIIWLADWLFG